jgi:hypothetical protein
MGFNNPLTGLNGSLIYPQIKSPNFNLAGKTGWAILKNGDAYFFNVTATGVITATSFAGTDFVINSSGAFFYGGVPAAGNLILALAPTGGTDAFGNGYAPGLSAGATGSSEQIVIGVSSGSPLIYFLSAIATALNNAALQLNVSGAGTAAHDTLVIKSSQDTAHTDYVAINLNGNSNDGVTAQTSLSMAYVNVASVVTFYQLLTSAGITYPKGVTIGGATPGLGDNGVGEISLANAGTVPTTNPTGGGVLYSKQGVPTWRDPGGQTLGAVRTYSADSSSNLASFTAETDVPGATVSVMVTGSNATVVVNAQFDMQLGTTVGDTMTGRLSWNGADRSEQAVLIAPTVLTRVCVARSWRITGVTAGTYIAKLTATCSLSAANNMVSSPHTGLLVTVIDQ